MTRTTPLLTGGVFHTSAADDELAELRSLAGDLARRSFDQLAGKRRRQVQLDGVLWQHLEDTGLARISSSVELNAGPEELAVVLYCLAQFSAPVPLVETDLLAAWLGDRTGLELPADGPMTVAIADATLDGSDIVGVATGVPWMRSAAAVVLVARTSDNTYAGILDTEAVDITDEQNLAGEPRERFAFQLPARQLRSIDSVTREELMVRGAWARCIQVVGALDAAALSAVAHCRERIQFDRPLSSFQSVQHRLAMMAGEVERARAATELAVAAASAHGFASPHTDFAVSVSKVVLASVTNSVVAGAHQLHGALGVCVDHPLWLSTLRAQSWIREFGSSNHHARKLGHLALSAREPWDVVIGHEVATPAEQSFDL